MKHALQDLIRTALQTLTERGELALDTLPEPQIERTRDPAHGDFATNVAMMLAKAARTNPRALAEQLVAALPHDERLARVEIAGPGFINFHLAPLANLAVIPRILELGDAYGRGTLGAGRRVQVEFVSANPTGPLHVGHGRGAAYGAAVADLLAAVGFEVQREYYVNDAGRQMDILATSAWLRYLERCGETLRFPSNGYRGEYVREIAATLYAEDGTAHRMAAAQVLADLPPDAALDGESAQPDGDKEAHIDALIARARALLGAERYRRVFDLALQIILDDIKDDLAGFGITYQAWFPERSLTDSGALAHCIERLRDGGHLDERDGALWFRATDFGDEKDRVLVRENGQPTYFASDTAYHLNKFERGFERVINVWGADHHGYVARMQAALNALGVDPQRLEVLLVQFAVLYRGGEKVQMSTRSGEFVTLRELREEVGRDAARFFYVMRRSEQHLDFDLDLARAQSADNPVYYVQYAHARIASVLRQAADKGFDTSTTPGTTNLERLTEPHEQALVRSLARYPELIENAALRAEPHQLTGYLRELANALHTYYNAHQFLVDDAALRDARLKLIGAVRQVLHNGLTLLGVSAPETM